MNHEILDDPVEGGALVALGNPVFLELARAELSEVFGRLGANVREQLEEDPPDGSVAHTDVEEHDGVVRMPERGRDLGPRGAGRAIHRGETLTSGPHDDGTISVISDLKAK